mmetsp:Transcript_13795/g.37918  ORF Transcript_13795/g.37918 Transcript_13795/m.37918 type:complete len:113 (-) Transcript_13795:1372-1710(-)
MYRWLVDEGGGGCGMALSSVVRCGGRSDGKRTRHGYGMADTNDKDVLVCCCASKERRSEETDCSKSSARSVHVQSSTLNQRQMMTKQKSKEDKRSHGNQLSVAKAVQVLRKV